jgi:hypothetical protein
MPKGWVMYKEKRSIYLRVLEAESLNNMVSALGRVSWRMALLGVHARVIICEWGCLREIDGLGLLLHGNLLS